MSTQTSNFVISPCTIADVPDMISVYNNAFAGDYFGSFIFPRTIDQEAKHNWLRDRLIKNFAKPGAKVFKISEVSTGKLAAWIRWGYPHKLSPEQKLEQEKEKENDKRVDAWPPGANLELCDLKFGGLDRFREIYIQPESTYVVYLLATDPAYQRKGLGSKLLQHSLDLADAEGRRAYIEATTMGRPVYENLGFRQVDVIEVDLSKWGGKEKGLNTIMVREPEVKTALNSDRKE